MGNRLSKLVTRTGDQGQTSLGNGSRTKKTSLRIQAIGEVDELNSWVGVIIEQKPGDDIKRILTTVQHVLFDIGGELSLPEQKLIDADDVSRLEEWIEYYNNVLPPLKEFILPGGTPSSAFCHCARAVCRRAERQLVALEEEELTTNPLTLVYLNRLSDLLFVLARTLARQEGGSEVYWNKTCR